MMHLPHLTDGQLAHIKAHAECECPMECCGILLADGTAMRCENVAKDRTRFAEIGNFELQRIARHNTVIGFYHSHVDRPPLPSQEDFAGANSFGMWYVIASARMCSGGRVTAIASYVLRGTMENKIFEHTVLRGGKTEVVQIVKQRA